MLLFWNTPRRPSWQLAECLAVNIDVYRICWTSSTFWNGFCISILLAIFAVCAGCKRLWHVAKLPHCIPWPHIILLPSQSVRLLQRLISRLGQSLCGWWQRAWVVYVQYVFMNILRISMYDFEKIWRFSDSPSWAFQQCPRHLPGAPFGPARSEFADRLTEIVKGETLPTVLLADLNFPEKAL